MHKPKSHLQVARWVNADLWGLVLNSQKPLRPLFNAIYNPKERSPANFVVRIQKTKPVPHKKAYSRFSLAMWERRKLCAFYGLSLDHLRRLAYRTQDHSSSYYDNFVNNLESMLYMFFWRVGFFKTPQHAKQFIYGRNVIINNIPVNSIFKRAVPGDYITFRHMDYDFFLTSLRRGIYHLRNSHLLINFRLPSIHYVTFPDPSRLFFYFSIDHKNFFFTTQFRKR